LGEPGKEHSRWERERGVDKKQKIKKERKKASLLTKRFYFHRRRGVKFSFFALKKEPGREKKPD